MKKSRILAAAMASIALTGSVSSCAYDACANVQPDVYGPPESFEESFDEPETPVKSEPAEDAGSDFDPAENIMPDVYGPPEAFGGIDGD